MKFAIRWNKRSVGPVYLQHTDSYERGTGQGFTPDINDALIFDGATEALAAVQERALNIDDVNSKLELVEVQTAGITVGDAL